MNTDILSEKDIESAMIRLLTRRENNGQPKVPEDEIRYYVSLERDILLCKTMQVLLEKGKIGVIWDEKKEDWIISSTKVTTL